MSDLNDPPIIRIVKKNMGHGGHHGGAWKVAFADFVTAMMALFIVLWILGQSEDVKRGIGGYFRDPTGKALLGAGPADAAGQIKAIGIAAIKLPTTMRGAPMTDERLESEADTLREFIEKNADLKGMKEQISVEVSAEGLRVEISEGENAPLFESGSSMLSQKLIAAIRALAAQYSKLPNKLIVEGHTDATPYSASNSMSNWELSTQRANEARRIMESSGLPQDQVLMVRGFADRKPRFSDPYDARNRRISMLLVSDQGMDIALGGVPEEESSGPVSMAPASKSQPKLYPSKGKHE
ncbi:OmpA family protein [bacterium]|nr:OmpA family protein [bacterium]